MTIYKDLSRVDFKDENPQRLQELSNTASNAAGNLLIGMSTIAASKSG